ncbi:acyl-CoA dehydrogenase family protein [Burkholderia ambifaria]|uniref:acyl-CoA dehydrogenase family protein n=1 Tax=Burkholderia ambifaria TaxID=152480 RepID=UPI001B9FA5E0|nr:acyl-CoA dehydrogenase family protein [Burkholderia ambifaria]MBR8256311.1 acyl-CoA dehydrogenase family protein [Burkholderia ambifaria]
MHLNQQQSAWQAAARSFAEREIAPLSREMDTSDVFPAELFRKIGESDFFGLSLPAEYGGKGADMVSAAVALVEISAANASVGFTLDAHWLSAETILHFGSEEQKRKYLPRAARDMLCAFALTEPSGGSDAASIQTTAEKDGDTYVLNGTKTWCTNSAVAGVVIVMAKTDPSAGDKGISAFLVETGTPGFTVTRSENKMGLRGGSVSSELSLENCRIHESCLLGKEGDGFLVAMQGLDIARICISAVAIGTAEAAYRYAKAHAKRRKAFGAPIASFQGVQFKVADMAIGIQAARLLLQQVATMADGGMNHRKESAILKVFASDLAMQAASEAVQIYGGNGYSKDYPVEQLFRDAKVLQIGEGTNEVLRMLIGRMAFAE